MVDAPVLLIAGQVWVPTSGYPVPWRRIEQIGSELLSYQRLDQAGRVQPGNRTCYVEAFRRWIARHASVLQEDRA